MLQWTSGGVRHGALVLICFCCLGFLFCSFFFFFSFFEWLRTPRLFPLYYMCVLPEVRCFPNLRLVRSLVRIGFEYYYYYFLHVFVLG